jgi:hypothetical protein
MDQTTMQADLPPWSVMLAVDDVPESGREITLSADEATRAAIASLAGVRAISRLEAALSVARHGRHGLHVTGKLSARVGQDCVVTLEPIDSEIDEPIDALFLPADKMAAATGDEEVVEAGGPDLEPMVGDRIDLGALATEVLLVGIDPYPRKPGAEFRPPVDTEDTVRPFAALAALKKNFGAE